MLLSKKYIFKNDKVNMTIIQYMEYSSYKLYNIGNYKKRKYEKLGLKNNFTCYDSHDNCFIINSFLQATDYYDKKMAYYQSIYSAQQFHRGVKYPQPSKLVLALNAKIVWAIFSIKLQHILKIIVLIMIYIQ